ncbi:hypothetical protein ABT124_40165 [Streptomyces sp. NPDC001982]
MHVSHETIYTSLFLQTTKAVLRTELTGRLRTGAFDDGRTGGLP